MISSTRYSVTFSSNWSWTETWKMACRISVRSTTYPIRQRICSGLLRIQRIFWDNKQGKPTVFGKHHSTTCLLSLPPPPMLSLFCFALRSTSALLFVNIPILPTSHRHSLRLDDWDHPRRPPYGNRMRCWGDTIKSEPRDTFDIHSYPHLIQTPDVPDPDNVFMYRI